VNRQRPRLAISPASLPCMATKLQSRQNAAQRFTSCHGSLVRRRTLPQGLLGQAIDYALKRWEALNHFITDGTLEIDNNLIENAIRPSALGKKNWLFVGHPEAGERSAVIYTLLGSCRRHGINPFEYLKDLFTHLPAAKITHIKEFTPAAWAKARGNEQRLPLAA
jgi:transposase